eukprot:TRINITY_DN2751_c0_g1_i8.p1 TRINITY_DN2751_c0_g1~~TRINITY_DN2751_c0_g1_i8.p1  ORF type:complete len:1267 (-),score=275.99 TRINITY_DN2751_c0_g1_i8:1005-4805(-)
MSVYFNNSITTPTKFATVCARWHPTLSVMAASTKTNAVYFYNEEGDYLESEAIQKTVQCNVLEWAPSARTIALGWADGTISLWNQPDQVSRDENFHRAPITVLAWAPDGFSIVAGDQDGMISIWRVDSKSRMTRINQVQLKGPITHLTWRIRPSWSGCPPFFVGNSSGTVYHVSDDGRNTEIHAFGSSLACVLHEHVKDVLTVMTKSLYLSKFEEKDIDKWEEVSRIKLGGSVDSAGNTSGIWVGPNVLCTTSNEQLVRVWHLNTDSFYTLGLAGKDKSEKATCISFSQRTRILTVGTTEGRVVLWKFVGQYTAAESSAQDWSMIHESSVGGAVLSLTSGRDHGLIVVVKADSISILSEIQMHRKLKEKVAVYQLAPDRLSVEQHGKGSSIFIKTNIRVKEIDITKARIAVWNSKKVEVYEINESGDVRQASSFAISQSVIAISQNALFMTTGSGNVDVCNFQGTVKERLPFNEGEGEPFLLDVNGDYLAVATSKGFIRVYSIKHREPRQMGASRQFLPSGDSSKREIVSIRCNADGSRVSIITNKEVGASRMSQAEPRVYVLELESDTITHYEFEGGQQPHSHYWDTTEPKLFCCEVKSAKNLNDDGAGATQKITELITMFSTPERGILVQDRMRLDKDIEACIGISLPHIFFCTKPVNEPSLSMGSESMAIPQLKVRIMRDFIGMEAADTATKEAMLNFSYSLTIGNMDEAYKAVRLIKSASVWENMATMSIKTRRLDVAEVCLGNMQHARASRALREAKDDESLPVEAKVAAVAIQLGMIEDAEQLYESCNRYDLLNKLYQATGRWDKAIDLAKQKDRIHLRTTHFLFARHLESVGDLTSAIKNYELSDTFRHEVPRMLFYSNNMEQLEAYVNTVNEPALFKWWAKFVESTRNYDKALHFYQKAADHFSLVRIYCSVYGNFQKAAEIVNESNSGPAAYHLAHHYELKGQVKEAINYYTRSKRYNHAIRLAKENGFENELVSLALQSSPEMMVDAAHYFEEKGNLDKAVSLYHKGGALARALDICFRGQLFDQLQAIADELGEHTDPELVARVAEFFLQHNQYDKAIHLYLYSAQSELLYDKAIDMAIERNIKITEEMADKITLPKSEDEAVNARRSAILKKLAKCCKKQGSYHLACKKYTQAGDKLKAMKALLRSGDTEKIVFFAGVSRQRELFILAANYLQSLDWRNDPEIMKNIIGFYNKAKAMDSLANFYDACSQVEIDEYQNYEKALGALKEALKYMTKAKVADKDAKVAGLQQVSNHS